MLAAHSFQLTYAAVLQCAPCCSLTEKHVLRMLETQTAAQALQAAKAKAVIDQAARADRDPLTHAQVLAGYARMYKAFVHSDFCHARTLHILTFTFAESVSHWLHTLSDIP